MPSEKQSHLKPNQSQLSPNPILPVAALSVSPLPFVPTSPISTFCVSAFLLSLCASVPTWLRLTRFAEWLTSPPTARRLQGSIDRTASAGMGIARSGWRVTNWPARAE